MKYLILLLFLLGCSTTRQDYSNCNCHIVMDVTDIDGKTYGHLDRYWNSPDRANCEKDGESLIKAFDPSSSKVDFSNNGWK